MATTINGMWVEAARDGGSRTAFMYRDGDDWRDISYADAHKRITAIGAGLLDLGIGTGDKVAILSNSRPEWTLCDYAALGAGATVVPIYQTNSPADCEYILDNCGAKLLVVEDAEQLAKIEGLWGNLPELKTIVVMDGAKPKSASNGATPNVLALADVEASGASQTERWNTASDKVDPNSLASLIYTSGTTGPPKGCMLSHDNYVHMTELVTGTGADIFRPDDRIVLFLPLAHTFARIVQFVATRLNMELAYSTVPTLMEDLAHVKPTILPSVPRVFEKAHTRIYGMFSEASGIKAKLISWSMNKGALRGKYLQHGRRVPPVLAAQYAIAHKLVFSKIHARFGGRLRLCVSGGAPLSRDVQEFFLSSGIIILEGYGLTECTAAATLNLPGNFRVGSVGPLLPETEVKIAEDHEILIKGRQVFQGYYRNEEATKEALSDGWLHSGDIGTIDREGFLYITDRKKDIIVTAGGKNVSPQNIENALKATQYVSQALVYGDRKPYLAALITLDAQELGTFAEEHKLPADMRKLIATDEVKQLVQDAVAKVNGNVGKWEQVKRYRILPIDFTQETGELTPTLKLKRKDVCARYGAYIDEMYGADSPDFDCVTDEAILELQKTPAHA